MNATSRTITGTTLIILGIGLTMWGVLNKVSWIHGTIALILGIAILLNKKEDQIEKIKSTGGKK
jgi:multisubunit Na+/H+ antiporter MnhG subunit